MGLLQTDDPVGTDVGVVVEHFLLLGVNHRNHSQTVPQPAGKPPFKVRDLSLERFQLLHCQFNVIQLLAYSLPAFGSRPLLAFCEFEVGFSGLLGEMWKFVALMRNLFPQNLNGGFQVLTVLLFSRSMSVGYLLSAGATVASISSFPRLTPFPHSNQRSPGVVRSGTPSALFPKGIT